VTPPKVWVVLDSIDRVRAVYDTELGARFLAEKKRIRDGGLWAVAVYVLAEPKPGGAR
jgi:hypothetical protein